jgi:hypothetical protein
MMTTIRENLKINGAADWMWLVVTALNLHYTEGARRKTTSWPKKFTLARATAWYWLLDKVAYMLKLPDSQVPGNDWEEVNRSAKFQLHGPNRGNGTRTDMGAVSPCPPRL